MESYKPTPFDETIASLPPLPKNTGLASYINKRQAAAELPILVVLDDDPTGCQTCHGINIVTVWDQQTLVEEFKSTNSGFYVLTNSRALHTPEARALIKEICIAVKEAAATVGKEFEVVLRGDSTLRGHFPDEPEVAEEIVGKADAWIVAPFFRQGGRLTINDVHYVKEGDTLVPAAQTPFAKDASFGYKNSNLVQYVVEKSKGSISPDDVTSITIDEIRKGGSNTVTQKLLGFENERVVIVNSVADEDMEVFVRGLLEARLKGKRYIYRTGAAFVSTRLGIEQIAPLTPEDLGMNLSPSAPGGLIIAGSYVPKTTAQLEGLISGRGSSLNVIIIDVEPLLASQSKAEATVTSAADQAGKLIVEGKDVLLMTSRKLITGSDEKSSLEIGAAVASALVNFLRYLNPRPRYVIAKGGITSSDAASKGLRMRRAEIAGQAASGVPLWRCHESTSKYTGIPFVVFPGNVGEKETLRDLVAAWSIPSVSSGPPAMEYTR